MQPGGGEDPGKGGTEEALSREGTEGGPQGMGRSSERGEALWREERAVYKQTARGSMHLSWIWNMPERRRGFGDCELNISQETGGTARN